MKKLLFLMVVGFGGAMLLKGNYVTIAPDNQVRVAGWAVPLPASVQASPVLGMFATMLQGNIASPPANAAPRPAAPTMPSVTSAVNTYNPNQPRAGQTQGGDQLSAVAKALH